MTKLVFINKGIVNTTIPELDSSVHNLSKAVELLSTLKPPSSTSVSFNNNISDLNTIIKRVNDLKHWCIESSMAFGKLETNYSSKAQALSKAAIPLRENVIKE